MIHKKVEIPKSMTDLSKALNELIEEAYTKIDSLKLEGEDHGKKLVAVATLAAALDRAEAVDLLAQKLKPDPALVVLRSMEEGYINLCYVLQTENDARLFAMFHDGAKSDLGRIKRLSEEMKKHQPIQGAYLTDEQANRVIGKLEKMRDDSRSKLKALKDPEFTKLDYPSLFDRAKRYDDFNAKSSQNTHLVLDYRMTYFYLSQFTHLGTSSLGDLVDQNPSEIKINNSDPIPKCELALVTAFAILSDTLILTLRRLDQPVDELFKELSEKIQKVKPPKREAKGLF